MRTITILSGVVMFAFLVPMVCLGITNGDFCLGNIGWSDYTDPLSSVSYYPSPLCYVRVLGARNETAVVWQEETGFNPGETWRARFTVRSTSVGLGGIITLGWSNISGDYAGYYREINSPGTYTVTCTNSNYKYVSVQCDGSSAVNTIVEVDSIETMDVSGTPTPTPTATPTPTPTATPITLPGEYTFNSSTEGWSFLPISGSNFSGASSGYSAGRVSIYSASGPTNRVGLWNGPTHIPYLADNVYRAQFTVSSSQATASQNPQLRMRWTQDLSLESASQVVNAAGSYSYSLPNDPTTKEYSCYFAPVLNYSLGVAFDMLDFDAGQYGTHYVDLITLERFSRPAAGTSVKTYTSSSDFSNWDFLTGIGGYGSVTSGGGGTGTLTITASTPAGANFGWWQSSGTANEMTYVADRLYRATYTLRCDSDLARNTMPQIRLRCQNEDGQMTQTMELNSQGTGPGSMPAVGGTDYDLYWETPDLPGSPSATEDGFIVTIDVLDFDTGKGGTIYMDSVAVDHVAIP